MLITKQRQLKKLFFNNFVWVSISNGCLKKTAETQLIAIKNFLSTRKLKTPKKVLSDELEGFEMIFKKKISFWEVNQDQVVLIMDHSSDIISEILKNKLLEKIFFAFFTSINNSNELKWSILPTEWTFFGCLQIHLSFNLRNSLEMHCEFSLFIFHSLNAFLWEMWAD